MSYTENNIIDGYTVEIAHDDSPSNPLSEFDCEPPTLVYYEGLDSYNNAPDINYLVRKIPAGQFARGQRVRLIRDYLNVSLREFVQHRRYSELGVRDAFAELLGEQCPEPDHRSWGAATDYFETLESLANLAGIPCYYATSRGYCQGDSALVIAFATPEWAAKVGAPADSLASQCEAAFDLYTAWAWGDVYGIASITDPDGNEVEDGSVWGFYGSDHEQSGLLDSARDSIAYHKEQSALEAIEASVWAARDTVTV